jgi:excinuclease ABC subunit A
VHEVLYKALTRELEREGPRKTAREESEEFNGAERQLWKSIERAHLLNEVILVDQTPIGRTPRSNPVTYVKAFDIIRELFASTPDSDRKGYTAGHVTVEMQFLADVELVCEECRGTRFKQAILDVKYKGLNIHQVLGLTIAEGLRFFADTSKLKQRLQVLADVGLGYLRLGQSATTLSGGEAQRVKLAAHLAQSTSEGTLFIFDEPTTGLHFEDIRKLLDSFQRLIHNGGSILLIEHNLDVIRAADWLIDLGPGGGAAGGRILGEGTPEQLAQLPDSFTGAFLRG